MFSKVDECDEEGRTGLIHATLQGKVGLISFIVTSKITALQGQAYILDITNDASCQSGEHGGGFTGRLGRYRSRFPLCRHAFLLLSIDHHTSVEVQKSL